MYPVAEIKMEWPEYANYPEDSKEYNEGLNKALDGFIEKFKARGKEINDMAIDYLINRRYAKTD